MRKFLTFVIALAVVPFAGSFAQTVIEMSHPEDAHLTLLVVDNIKDADFAVYRTSKKSEYQQFDYMWNFKKWGFSNFSVYLTKADSDSLLFDNDYGIRRIVHGKVYFTENPDERGIKKEGFVLEGVMRKVQK